MKIDTVIFDLGGVLTFPHDREILLKILDAAGMKVPIDHFVKEYFNFRYNYDAGLMNAREYWSLLCDKFGGHIDDAMLPEIVRMDVQSWLSINSKMVECLYGIRKKAKKLALLSNINYDALDEIERIAGWLPVFDCRIYSCLEKIAKPDERIYELTLERLSANHAQSLFIDDNDSNIKAAQAFGVNTILFTGYDDFISEMKNYDIS